MWNAFFKPIFLILLTPFFILLALMLFSMPLLKLIAILGFGLLLVVVMVAIRIKAEPYFDKLDRKLDKLSGKRYI